MDSEITGLKGSPVYHEEKFAVARESCSRCYGTGQRGRNITTGKFYACKCATWMTKEQIQVMIKNRALREA